MSGFIGSLYVGVLMLLGGQAFVCMVQIFTTQRSADEVLRSIFRPFSNILRNTNSIRAYNRRSEDQKLATNAINCPLVSVHRRHTCWRGISHHHRLAKDWLGLQMEESMQLRILYFLPDLCANNIDLLL